MIVPDLIGHGDSEKLPYASGPARNRCYVAYTYLENMLTEIGATSEVTLVLHDLGSVLDFHWACEHREHVRGLTYMESVVRPFGSWNEWPENANGIFQGFRSVKDEDLVLCRNLFIEAVLPSSVMRKLADQKMAEYSAPFVNRDNR